MPKVIVPSLRYKQALDGSYIPTTDITPAEEFGELVYLTPPGNWQLTQENMDTIIERMECVREDDIILLTGDIVVCAVVIGEMAARFDMFRVLRWHGRDNAYAIEEWDWCLYDEDTPDDELLPMAAE